VIEDIIVVGAATFGVVSVVRLVLSDVQWMTRPIAKILLVLVVAFALTPLLFSGSVALDDGVLILFGGVGVATILHRLHRLLGAVGDRNRLEVLQGDVRRRRL
jgi:hypothetical protein